LNITSSGIVMHDDITHGTGIVDGEPVSITLTITNDTPHVLPLDMKPGQTVTYQWHATTTANGMTVVGPTMTSTETLVGFETLSIAGKTFTNVCHFKHTNSDTDSWVAPGYGGIRTIFHDADGDHLIGEYGGPAS
jgi:hypothetical protein